MGEALGVADAFFDAAVSALDGVAVVGHGFAGGFVDEFEPVAEVHGHRQQAAERGRDEGVADDDGAGAADDHVAVGAGAAQGRGGQAVDEDGGTDGTGDRAAAGGGVAHAGGGQAVEIYVGGAAGYRVGAMPW